MRSRCVGVGQSCSPAPPDIIGARRVRTAVMISSGSIPCRWIDVVPEVGVAELSLDDVERKALAGERMRVAQLVRREAAPDPGAPGQAAELAADGGA